VTQVSVKAEMFRQSLLLVIHNSSEKFTSEGLGTWMYWYKPRSKRCCALLNLSLKSWRILIVGNIFVEDVD
jgi:hypothetical protein